MPSHEPADATFSFFFVDMQNDIYYQQIEVILRMKSIILIIMIIRFSDINAARISIAGIYQSLIYLSNTLFSRKFQSIRCR
jgi:hypothetical protein